MAKSYDLGDLEYAGGMKFRFVDVTEDNYDGGIDFNPNDINLNRFQFVDANVVSGAEADTAEYHRSDGVIEVVDGGSELTSGSSVTVSVLAIGR